MEDTYTVVQVGKNSNKGMLYCVFDGHGGSQVAEMCAEKVAQVLENELTANPTDVSVAIRRTFAKLDVIASNLTPTCGCTALIVLELGNRFWVANCGDALAMVSSKNGQSYFASKEHKVEAEKERIVAKGGMITYDDGCARINRMLNIARSIGDYHLKKFVISDPFITTVTMGSVKFLALASDGMWDVFTPQEINTSIVSCYKRWIENGVDNVAAIDRVVKDIIHEAYMRGSTDNITFILLWARD